MVILLNRNSSAVVRAGETHPFDCPYGFFTDVANEDYTKTWKDVLCLPDGTFEENGKICGLIPCTPADIDTVLPADNNGALVSTAEGNVNPNDYIYFKCSDANKVE